MNHSPQKNEFYSCAFPTFAHFPGMADTFTIKLPVFEGPFDLLLFFIERDELDIYNIPIAKITDDFLSYMHQAQSTSIDLASEFIVVAATLMRIKAKMLLPRKQIDEEGNEIDPRQELVDRLLEYKRYKSVMEDLRRLEEVRAFMNPRGFASAELQKMAQQAMADSELESISLYKLLRVFERLLTRFEEGQKAKRVHTVYNFEYTIQDQRKFLKNNLEKGKKTDFETLFLTLENRIHAIVTFLALLELLNEQEISLVQGEGYNNFWLSLPEEETAEGETEK
ncbi:segregation/condensation protein A [Runella sp.]|uniref:segregation and condensation protein A n=1 Tax=Runella sp. TaxID=1960881 RepID=UPI003015F7DE